MKNLKSVLMALGAGGCLFFSLPSNADGLFGDDGLDLILGITAGYILNDHSARVYQADYPRRRDRRRGYHEGSYERNYNRNQNRNYNSRRYDRGFRPGPRNDYGPASFTSEPVRGGSSRRTRIIANPFSDRIVTGITLTGIDNDFVHIEDVVSYPGRYLLSPLDYTLSAYAPSRFINTGHHIDYISVAAKRKEYFTVTFHYQ
ncbi:MAG: hypothetical protein GKR91_03205 [Pseudomonadales bacterium]|nr:hypothetical protein [Pseudomonadales bacterium]